MAGIPPLTEAVHSCHAYVTDPVTGMAIEASANRTACHRCHPGSETRCLRGAIGHATNGDAFLAIQCQDCHGSMSMVGSASRQGWFEEPVCQSCHTGTATINAGQIRFLSAFDAKPFWKGYQIGCYTCHNGPDDDHANSNNPPTVADLSASTGPGTAVTVALTANDADGDPFVLRLVSQPQSGRAGVAGTTATYIPDAGFSGTDTFTYAAWDGQADSNLGTMVISVGGLSPCTVGCSATAPATGIVGETVTFSASASATGCTGSPVYSWSFGDGAVCSDSGTIRVKGKSVIRRKVSDSSSRSVSRTE